MQLVYKTATSSALEKWFNYVQKTERRHSVSFILHLVLITIPH
jgi:hypothetical protein